MKIELLFPERGEIELADLRVPLPRTAAAAPFEPCLLETCASLSQRLMRDGEARGYPQLQALGFRIRKAELERLRRGFESMETGELILAPRGLVFHLPPRNVDTMFVYSWLLAFLTGNASVIRLSPLRSEVTRVLLRLFGETLACAPDKVREGTAIVSYGHEPEATELLSSLCDVRVIWGGDATVDAIRRFPLSPDARELAFPDRYSLAAIDARAYNALPGEARDDLVRRFFNDAFWFDQMACSSPRTVIWCGDGSLCAECSADFFPRVAAHARGHMELSAAQSVAKFAFACSSVLRSGVTSCLRLPELTVARLASVCDFDRRHPGGGFFFEAFAGNLNEIAPALWRRDQTLTAFGFGEAELRAFARQLNGRAIDRIVPIGRALDFGRFWDGHDLLREFCRHIHIAQQAYGSPGV